jgi:hypothetical protein
MLSPKLHHNQTGVAIVEVKDLRQTRAIEMGYREANPWLEWINYSILTLNKTDCYACVARRPEPQVFPFPRGWTTDPAGMAYLIVVFQERTTCGNRSFPELVTTVPLDW